MAINDKTRKILWGRSGNRCAVCRAELVIAATDQDEESVIGEEAHIVSPRGQGPRYSESFPEDQLDTYGNRILLCRTDHKMVDDQVEAYSVEKLQAIKTTHENWVMASLAGTNQLPRMRLREVKGQRPTYLIRITSGTDLWRLLDGAFAFEFSHDEPETPREVERSNRSD